MDVSSWWSDKTEFFSEEDCWNEKLAQNPVYVVSPASSEA
jgi:hypothetical protein